MQLVPGVFVLLWSTGFIGARLWQGGAWDLVRPRLELLAHLASQIPGMRCVRCTGQRAELEPFHAQAAQAALR